MTVKTKATSRILDAVHETERDLHAAGGPDEVGANRKRSQSVTACGHS
jgi:hypothetical protein